MERTGDAYFRWSVPICKQAYIKGIVAITNSYLLVYNLFVFLCIMYTITNTSNLKSIIFWNMTPCSPSSFNRCFGRTYRLHIQGRGNKFSNCQIAHSSTFRRVLMQAWKGFHTKSVEIFTIRLPMPMRFHISLCSDSVASYFLKRKFKYTFRAVAMLLFYIINNRH
jgi:hypothetical protein